MRAEAVSVRCPKAPKPPHGMHRARPPNERRAHPCAPAGIAKSPPSCCRTSAPGSQACGPPPVQVRIECTRLRILIITRRRPVGCAPFCCQPGTHPIQPKALCQARCLSNAQNRQHIQCQHLQHTSVHFSLEMFGFTRCRQRCAHCCPVLPCSQECRPAGNLVARRGATKARVPLCGRTAARPAWQQELWGRPVQPWLKRTGMCLATSDHLLPTRLCHSASSASSSSVHTPGCREGPRGAVAGGSLVACHAIALDGGRRGQGRWGQGGAPSRCRAGVEG